jgi:23S rRNA C2498 (ribose-2'-O)-methylase RlmM
MLGVAPAKVQLAKVVTIPKGIAVREIFMLCPQMKKRFCGVMLPHKYFASTVDEHGIEAMTGQYGKNQGQKYQKLY